MEFFTFGHLVVLAIVALVLFFGWKQLPDMARSLGRSMRVFKTEIKGMSDDDKARAAAADAEKAPKAIEASPGRSTAAAARVPAEPGSATPTARPRPTPGRPAAASSVEPARADTSDTR